MPWRSLGSQPCNVEIKDVWLAVQPLTDASAWQSPETLENSFEKKDEMIQEMAKTLFEELLKTAEEKQEERGMTAGLITKIIDNL